MRSHESVVVTGASRGLGAALAQEQLQRGYRVVMVARSEADLQRRGAQPGSKEETWALRPAAPAERNAELLELPDHVVIDELTIHPMQQDF